MMGSMEYLIDLKQILAGPIGFPNGSHVLATNEGSTKLFENWALSNVLYVPGLAYNLIYVAQIINETDCVVAFSKHMCVTSKMLIGPGERKDGLHSFQGQPGVKVHKVTGVDLLYL